MSNLLSTAEWGRIVPRARSWAAEAVRFDWPGMCRTGCTRGVLDVDDWWARGKCRLEMFFCFGNECAPLYTVPEEKDTGGGGSPFVLQRRSPHVT